jgi:hypothetical protein
MAKLHPLSKTVITKEQSDHILRSYLKSYFQPFKAPTGKSWPADAEALRKQVLQHVVFKGIPDAIVNAKPKVVHTGAIDTGHGYTIKKLRYEIYPDFWIPAALYVPNKIKSKAPVMINPNGHTAGGKAADYKQVRCVNLARRGVIALNFEYIGMGELFGDRQHDNINHLNFTGLSGVGLFFLAMSKGLDIALALPKADKSRVGVTGLSGGGWQSIFFGALDKRINLCVPVAGYTAISKRLHCDNDLGDSEQTPTDLATLADYDMLTAMLAPRAHTLLINNENDDCCFQSGRVKPVIFDPVMPSFKSLGKADNFEFYSNTDPGTHNYLADNRRRLYQFLNKHWKLAAPETDLHTPEEIHNAHDLDTGLPVAQHTMISLAVLRARQFAQNRPIPTSQAQKEAHRQALAQTIRLPDYTFGKTSKPKTLGKGITGFTLQVGPWTLPVVKVQSKSKQPTKAQIIIHDTSRMGGLNYFKTKIDENATVYYIDILGFGELTASYLLHLVLSSIGQRSIGVQAAQLLAATRFVQQETGIAHVDVLAGGYAAGPAALIAAALEPALFGSVCLNDVPQSLASLLEMPFKYSEIPSVLCFGLLETTDVRQLKAIADGVTFLQYNWDITPFHGGH